MKIDGGRGSQGFSKCSCPDSRNINFWWNFVWKLLPSYLELFKKISSSFETSELWIELKEVSYKRCSSFDTRTEL